MDTIITRRPLPSNEQAELIRQLVKCDVCIIWKNSASTNWLDVVGWSSDAKPDENYIDNIKLAIKPSSLRHFEADGNSFFLRDVSSPDVSEIYMYQNEAIERGWKSLITTPLIHQNKIIGVIDSYWYRVIEKTDSVEIQKTLHSLSKLAVKSINTSYDTKPLTYFETIIHDISRIRTEETLDEKLNILVDIAKRMLNAKGGKLYMRIPETNRLVLKNVQGISSTIHKVGDILDEGEGMAGDVFIHNQPKVVPEYDKYDNRVKRLTGIFEAVIEVPIRQDNEPIGVLGIFDDKAKRLFSESEDVPLLLKLADLAATIIRDQEFVEGKMKRARDLEMVEKVIHEFNARLDTEGLLRTVAELIKEHLECSHCTIFFPSRQQGRDVLIPMYTAGTDADKIMERIFFRDDPGLLWRVFERQQTEIFHDATNHPDFAPARSNSETGRSLLIAPMKVEGRIVGMISADQDQPVFFKAADKPIVDILAKHAGMAIERQSALKTMEDNSQWLIEKINHEKLDEILEKNIDSALKLTGMDTGVIHIIKWDGDKPKIDKTHKFPKFAYYPPARIDQDGHPIGLTREVVNAGKAVLVSDTFGFLGIRDELANVHHSCIGLPLFYGESVIGALFLDDDRPHIFHEAELSRLNTLVNFAAAAIRNAQQFENQLEAINEIAQMITIPLNIRSVQEKILSWTNLLINDASMTVLGVIDTERKDVYAYAASGKPVDEKYHRRVVIGEGVVGRVAQTGKPILLNDVTKFPGYKPLRDDIKSELAIPIIIDGEVKGILDINHPKINAFTGIDIELASAIARLSGLAFKNAELSLKLVEHIVNKEQERAIDLMRSDTLHSMINVIGTIPHWANSVRTVIVRGSFAEKEKAIEFLDKLDRDISVIESEMTQLRQSSISRSELDVAKLTGSIIAELEATFGSSIIFNFDYDPYAYILNGVEFSIREAFYNIFRNAVEAILKNNSTKMGLVSVKLSKEIIDNSDKITVVVKDNGIGINHENWESIFELGVSSQGKYLDSGWGYGLWRSRSILNEIGGNISVVESIPGKGSTFKITLNA